MTGPASAPPPRRPLALEVTLVVVLALAMLVPGIWSYSLVDPWETHYGEVSREMLADHDWVHTDWQGNPDPEGFRSKPVLSFWMMATSMRAVGLAADGGYSGEMEHDARTMIAVRMPFILFGTLGLAVMWWMLASLVDRKLAWLSLLVVGSTPFYCLVARQAIPDMPLVSTVIGALAMFLMACEDGDRPIAPFATLKLGRLRVPLDARHVLLAIVGGFIAVQAVYYAIYFTEAPGLAVRGKVINPAFALPLGMAFLAMQLSRDGFAIARILPIGIGGIISTLRNEAVPARRPDQTAWRAFFDNTLATWERHAIDRYAVRGLVFVVAWATGDGWAETNRIADRILGMQPVRSMRQIYMLWCFAFLGIGILAKGPPGLAVVGLVGVLHVVLLGRWRALYTGSYELKRGLLLLVVVFLPWHVAMYLKEGLRFIDEYLFTHILNRAAADPDHSLGTFEMYTSQLGHGMWLWAGLLPAAFVATVLRARTDTRAGRVRFHMALWAISGAFFFSLVETKFHHYILPVVPALGILVAWHLRDIWAREDRLHPLFAVLGAGIVLLICRDLIFEPEHWIEMFVYRYDRPWPNGEPWQVDPSSGFLVLGVVSALAILALGLLPWRRLGVLLVGASGLAIGVWALQAYMPVAGTHWGMRDAIHSYYKQRTIYGEKIVYFGSGELWDDWHGVTDRWTFETFVPDNLQVGQPMTIHVQINKVEDERISESEQTVVGTVAAVGDHDVTVQLAPHERPKLDALMPKGADGPRSPRPPVYEVDADRLIAWQLYWRGENFWSGNEILSYLPEMKTVFMKVDNQDFQKYLGDRTKLPLGRRTFLITESGRAATAKSMLPTARGKESFEIVDTTSNKFTLVSFTL
jgi:4-amino-4-deoxy-L-arabinose transferase-like glycosyltransferase|nr:glycosyltransferase family 39 protein [Kofleriaceae bacterium]